jgi:hypothetical protein
MKYVIAVLLSVLFCALIRPTPALTKTVEHNAKVVKPTAKPVTTTKAVRPQPEKAQEAVARPKPVPKPQIHYASGCQRYDSLFRQYSWNVNVAEAICEAESKGDPYAVSPASLNYDHISDFGLMQLHGMRIFEPSANIAAAYRKYQTQGWHAWSSYNRGVYLSYL